FVLLFGKLWLPPVVIPASERYPSIALVESGLAMVAPHAWIVAALGLGLLGLAALLARRLGLLAAIPVGLGGLALLAGALEPDLVRNLAGFARNLWTSPERLHHRYYGDTGEPI